MRIHLRLDSVNAKHIRETVFIDGQNCGTLCFDHGQYQAFGDALMLGADRMRGQVAVEHSPIAHDAEGNFTMPAAIMAKLREAFPETYAVSLDGIVLRPSGLLPDEPWQAEPAAEEAP